MKRLKISAAGVFAFYFAANGFILFNFIPQHDGLNYINMYTSLWEYQLGRFMQTGYWKLRGAVTMPWLIGLLSMLFLSSLSTSGSKPGPLSMTVTCQSSPFIPPSTRISQGSRWTITAFTAFSTKSCMHSFGTMQSRMSSDIS